MSESALGRVAKAGGRLINAVLRPLNLELHQRARPGKMPLPVEVSEAGAAFATIDGMRFRISTGVTYWRANTLLTKEKSTIAWLDTFTPEDVFWDIGANVGAYTIYAAVKRRCKVYAFEPIFFNYDLLNQNIVANGVSDRALAYCVALNDRLELGAMKLGSLEAGSAQHSFNNDVRDTGERFVPVVEQGMLGLSVDALVGLGTIPFPTRIKIDVDGNEPKIVAGAKETLRDPKLKSVMVELNPNSNTTSDVIRALSSAGLEHAAQIKSLPGAPVDNYFFERKSDVRS